jgi:hypothetical protein
MIILALLVPRVLIVILWIFTNWFQGVFDTVIWPVLGFLLFPTTLIWYSMVQNWFHGVWGFFQIFVLILVVMIDLSPAGGRKRHKKT